MIMFDAHERLQPHISSLLSLSFQSRATKKQVSSIAFIKTAFSREESSIFDNMQYGNKESWYVGVITSPRSRFLTLTDKMENTKGWPLSPRLMDQFCNDFENIGSLIDFLKSAEGWVFSKSRRLPFF